MSPLSVRPILKSSNNAFGTKDKHEVAAAFTDTFTSDGNHQKGNCLDEFNVVRIRSLRTLTSQTISTAGVGGFRRPGS